MTNILIVEDEAITAMDIKNRLNNLGFEVAEIVSRGIDAIKKAGEFKPDLILMDITLKGDMDGIEASSEIKRLYDIPVIYMSAFSDVNTFEQLKLTNPYGFISKPVSTEMLIVSIETAIYKHNLDKKLSRSEERLRLIFDSSKDFIYSYDSEGRFTGANKKLCQDMHLSEDQIIGKTHQDLGFPEKQCQEWEMMHKEVYRTNSTITNYTSTPMPDGKIYHYEVILNPLHDKNNKIIGISGITRDITAQKKLKKELDEMGELFQNVFDNAQFGIAIGDAEGHIVNCNPAFQQMLGYTKNELEKMHFSKFTYPDDLKKELPFIEDIKNGKITYYEIEKRYIRKDKELIWVKLTAGFSKKIDGNPVNTIAIVENITEYKKT